MITEKEVQHVANLARLELTEEETKKYAKQLGELLTYVEQMNEVDTTGVKPMSHVTEFVNVMRDDEIVKEFTKEDLMKNAPVEEDGFFRVPKIS